MTAASLARICSGRLHYAWIVLAVMVAATLAGVGIRTAPGVMIVPLQRAFGWDVGTISAAISVNIILMGATGPFITGFMEVFGLKRTILLGLMLLIAGAGLSIWMTEPWQLFVTWGLMIGLGCGAGAVSIGAAVANRWFAERNGLAMGLLFAATAGGQVIFLPFLALLADRFGWQAVALASALAVAAMLPVIALFLPETPADIGTTPYGADTAPRLETRTGDPFSIAFSVLAKASRSPDFWLLTLSFAVCGFSTNGLINTHLIAYCSDRGITPVTGAWVLAAVGVFSLIGSTLSGWLCDHYNPRILLFWYYSLRGLSLILVPFSQFDPLSLTLFAIFYGLDWVATGPPTVALTNVVFGRADTPVIIAWIFAAHQVGGALAAWGAGEVRSVAGDYFLAFVASGLACLLASMFVLRINRAEVAVAAAE
jgi:predicted MFS family arabinose efflux permease